MRKYGTQPKNNFFLCMCQHTGMVPPPGSYACGLLLAHESYSRICCILHITCFMNHRADYLESMMRLPDSALTSGREDTSPSFTRAHSQTRAHSKGCTHKGALTRGHSQGGTHKGALTRGHSEGRTHKCALTRVRLPKVMVVNDS